MDKFLCSKLAFDHFSGKEHIVEFETFAGNKFEFKTYEVKVAVFGDNFNQPPVIESVRVRLSDDEYLLLLQWQLQNPDTGFNACDGELCEIIGSIEYQVEDKIFGDNEIGTYAIYLSEIRQDVAIILHNLEQAK
ncbi:MAG: hypothetical protein IKY57_03390 [Alistipes sp.]|nr:hypothetical protein [Alistipes sp.]